MLDTPQNNQNTTKGSNSPANVNAFDDKAFDELWDVTLNSPTEKKPEPLTDRSKSGVLDWGDLDSAEIWDDIMPQSEVKKAEAQPKGESEQPEKAVTREQQAATPRKALESEQLKLSSFNFNDLAKAPAKESEAEPEKEENVFANSTVALNFNVLEKFAEAEPEKEKDSVDAPDAGGDLLGDFKLNLFGDAQEEDKPEEKKEKKDIFSSLADLDFGFGKKAEEKEAEKPAEAKDEKPAEEKSGVDECVKETLAVNLAELASNVKESSELKEKITDIIADKTEAKDTILDEILGKSEDKKSEESKSDDKKSEESKSEESKSEESKSEDKPEEIKSETAENADEVAADGIDSELADEIANDMIPVVSENYLDADEGLPEEKGEEKAAASESDSKDESGEAAEESEDSVDGTGEIKFSARLANGTFASGEFNATMNERARMGKFEPENEVVTSEHPLSTDFYYADYECLPETTEGGMLKKVLIAAIVLIAAGLVFLVFFNQSETTYPYPQQAGFNFSRNHYDHIYVSPTGSIFGMCSDTRGFVSANIQQVADFWPGLEGCAGMRVSEDGSTIYYIDNSYALYEINLNNNNGFTPKYLTTLQDLRGNEFDVVGNEVVYFAKESGTVFRHQNIVTGDIKDDPELPQDALPCDGIFGKQYSYVTKTSLVFVDGQKNITADLDAPKLGCSRRYVKACATTQDKDWSILCNQSIREGHGSNSNIPIAYENESINSGEGHFKLIRHEEGTELITANEWIQVRNGKSNAIALEKHSLDEPFDAIYTPTQSPIIGAIDGNYMRIGSDGVVKINARHQLLGAMFVSDGTYAIIFDQALDGDKTQLILWNLKEAQLFKISDYERDINAINVSNTGLYGFILSDEGKSLHWFSWLDGTVMNSTLINDDIEDVIWSDDDQYVLIHYVNHESVLYQISDHQFIELRHYPAEVSVSFAHSDMLWHMENNKLMVERILDGALSVVYDVPSRALSNNPAANYIHITSHPNTDKVFFWSESGLFVYDPIEDEMDYAFADPVTWLTVNRMGTQVATNAGILDLETMQLIPLPDMAKTQKLRWTGGSNYMQSDDGSFLISLKQNQMLQSIPNFAGIRLIGSNVGEHPSADLILANRDDISTLELLDDNHHPKILGAFAGNSYKDWCWQAPDESVQAEGSMYCKSYKKEVVLKSNVPAIASSMKATLTDLTKDRYTSHTPLPFITESNLSITTIPEITGLTFYTVEGAPLPDEPKELIFEEGFVLSPFNVTMSKSDDTFIVVAEIEGYESRGAVFQPNSRNTNVRIPLLASGAVTTTALNIYDLSNSNENNEPTEIEVSDDLGFEFRTIAYEHYDSLKSCLAGSDVLKMVLSEDRKLQVSPEQSELQGCADELISDINEKRQNGALPDLDVLSDIRIDLTIR